MRSARRRAAWLGLSLSLFSVAARAWCGDGRIDPGERCDPGVRWADRCPEPWGLCWQCAQNCRDRVLSSGDSYLGVIVTPFCSETHPSGVTTRRYDARGHVTALDLHGEMQWAFDFDESGHNMAHHATYHGRTEHLFRAWGPLGVTRAWLDNDRDGAADQNYLFSYNPDGRLDRVWLEMADPHAMPGSDRRYTYDRQGRVLVDEQRFGDATWHNTDATTYDALGRTIYTRHVGMPRWADSECRTLYDAAGATERCVTGAPDTARQVVRVKRRDRHGHIVWSFSIEADGRPVLRRFTLIHNPRGEVIEEVERDAANREVGRWRRRYDPLTGIAAEERWVTQRASTYRRDFGCLRAMLPRLPWRETVPR